MNTPWGKADHVKNIGRGILSVSTASHGGLFVPIELRELMHPETQITWAGAGWYEEDGDWALVALSFPELFNSKTLESAKRTVSNWKSREVCQALGVEYNENGIHADEVKESAMLAAGEWIRCSALGVTVEGRDMVHVLFRNVSGETIGRYMEHSTYDAFPLMKPKTIADYESVGKLSIAPESYKY